MNDSEREQWVNDDYYLYTLKDSVGVSMRRFIRENRAEIDAYIQKELSKKPRN